MARLTPQSKAESRADSYTNSASPRLRLELSHQLTAGTMTAEPTRPLLLPQNRRLRHLQGIYIRNITLSRPRGKTIDDAGLNKSPQKLEALREPQLQHSYSSTDLRRRPVGVRRQSSSQWVGASPDYRQKKLESVIDNRMVDTFFSLHVESQEQPLYISEVVNKAMNATFRFFDLSDFSPAITRLDTFTVRVWVRRNEFIPLIEQKVSYRHYNSSAPWRAIRFLQIASCSTLLTVFTRRNLPPGHHNLDRGRPFQLHPTMRSCDYRTSMSRSKMHWQRERN